MSVPTKAAATVTIREAAKMTAKGRKKVANWLRGRAKLLENHADLLAPRFTSKYFYK